MNETVTTPPALKSTLEAPSASAREFVETCIAERHNYARHIFTSVVGWFTFFVTVNYASMGWLASSADRQTIGTKVVLLIAILFIIQNSLGVAICLVIRSYFYRSNRRILGLQAGLASLPAIIEDNDDLSGQTCMPIRLYSTSMVLMVAALAPILISWCILPILFHP